MGIKATTRRVYWSERRNRTYVHLRSAIKAEAKAIIIERYPHQEDDYGRYFSWYDLPNSEKLLRRVMRLVKTEFSKQAQEEQSGGV